jgi:hypothetical protein
MHLGGTNHSIATGGVAVAPRRLPHAFMVVSESATILCLHTPGSREAFSWDASRPLAPARPARGSSTSSALGAPAQRNGGIELLGPPSFPA